MKRVFKQWLAGLLSVVLLFTLLPAAALAEEADGATGQTTAEQVQALIDALPDAEEITAENRADVQAQIDAIDAAMVELTEDEAAALDTARYDAAVAALLALDAPSALEQVQALIDALPDAESITADNRADVEAQLTAIDEAKQDLTDDELDTLDITRYMAVLEALLALDNMAGADEPRTIATVNNVPYVDADGSNKTCGSATEVDNNTTAWNNTWYVVSGNVTISSRITVTGNVYLILKDSCTLTAQQGISVIDSNSLTIYCQSGHTGTLVATNPTSGGAAIGAGQSQKAGSIIINGGNITAAVTAAGGACIGMGGWGGTAGSVTVNGGCLKLICNAGGEGAFGNEGTVTINGGIVEYSGSTDGTASLNHATKNGGIVFNGDRGQVYGDYTLKENYTIPAGKSLVIPSGGKFTISENVTLTNEGSISNSGDIVIPSKGKLDNTNGSITNIDKGTITGQVTGRQPETVNPKDYLDWNQSTKSLEQKTAPNDPIPVTNSSTTWENNWYVVTGNVTIDSRITVSGTVHLILPDGCNLEAKHGINLAWGSNLFIYGQTNQTGVLTAGYDENCAAIGGNNGNEGTITINGGTIYAANAGYGYGAAIGGGRSANGTVTINGGTIYATSVKGGAAIGGGESGNGTITINGGTVHATASEWAAAIGGSSDSGNIATVTINGGTVNATGARVAIRGNLLTGADGDAVIRASSISDKSQQSSWSGIIFEGNNGQVYGSQTVKNGFAVNAGENLAIPSTSTLTVPDGVTVNNDGTIEVWGTLNGEKNIDNGTSGKIIYYRLDVTAPTFDEAKYGYAQPDGQSITIKNDNVDATIESVTVDNNDFEIVGEGSKTVKQGETINNWKIRPKTGLTVGTYTANIIVKYSKNAPSSGPTTGTATAEVSFTVTQADTNITADPVTYTYGAPDGITLTAHVAPAAANGISLMSAAQNQVVFTFPKGSKTETKTVDPRGGTVTVNIPVEDVKEYLDPGKNNVTVSYGGSENLKEKDSVTMTVTVEKKTLGFTFTATGRAYDGGNVVTGTLQMTTELVGSDNVTATLQEGAATAASADAGMQTVTVDTSKVDLNGADAEYYEVGNIDGGTVNISKAKISSVTAPTVENPTYNGEEQELLSGSGNVPDGATITYYVGAKGDSSTPSGSESGWDEMNTIKAKDAGTYTVWYKVAGGTNYENIEPTRIGEAKIGQKEVALTWAGYSGLTYSGNPVNVTATADTGISGESVNVTVENGANTNAGTYIATASGLTDGTGNADNYKLPAGVTQEYIISPVAVSFAIDPEDKATWPTDETNADPNPTGYAAAEDSTPDDWTDYALSMTYDSYDHKASVAQTEGETVKIEAKAINGFSVTYKRIKDAAGDEVTEDAKDSVRDAGTYEIWVSINPVEGENYNYIFDGHDSVHSLKIGEITVAPFPTAVSWAHLKYVYHGHNMHPEIHVLNPFKADDVWMASGLPEGFDHEHPEAYAGDYLVAFAETKGSDVGVYPVTAKFYGKNAGNYTITDPTGSVTITPAPVTITVGDNTWVVQEDGTLSRNTVTLRPAWGAVTVAPDAEEGTDHQYPLAGSAITDKLKTRIEYRDPKTGEAVEAPTEPGTYEVWVEIGDTNFRHSGGSDGALRNVGELVITNNPSSVKSYTVKFDPGYEGAPAGPDDMTGVFANQTVVIPPVSGENEHGTKYNIARKGWSFLGWSYNGRTYKPNEEFHMPASDVTFKAEWIEAVDVSGTVKRGNDESAPVLPGATVTLKQGSEEVAETVTKGDGTFTFPQVTPGVYNLEVRYHSGDTEIVKTFLVEVGADSDTPEAYLMPDKALNTVVEVAPGITAAVNLDRITESQETSEVYTESDKNTVEAGGKVEFKMSVSGGELTTEQTEKVPVPEDRIGMVLDLELTKTVTSRSGETARPVDIHDATVPVTTIIHLPAELQGKSSYTIYRFHDMSNEGDDDTLEMQTITTSPNSDGEYLKIVRDGTAIEIYAEFYSTYVLTWEQSSGGSGSSRYPVNLPSETDAGTITSNPTSARPGSRVTLTVTPNEGYHLKSLTVTNRNGKPVELTDNGDGTYTFTMPYSQVTVAAEFVKCGSLDFTDLDTSAWYHDYTDYVIANGLMNGIGGGLFEPSGTVNRAQMVMVLWNMSDKPVVNYYMTYSDVTEGIWYSEAIRWATSEGIVGGYGNGKFGPNDPITREQMAAMIYRYEQKYGEGGFTGDWMYRLPFTDLDQISDWAFEPVAWCNMKGVIKGKGNSVFDPKGLAKRSEMAAILTRYCGEETGEE